MRPRTLYNPRLGMHIPLERIEDIGMATGMTRFLTTLRNRSVTISAETHSDETFRGWASFYSDGNDETILRHGAVLALNNIQAVTFHVSVSGSKSQIGNTTEVSYQPFSYGDFPNLKNDVGGTL